MSNRNNIPINIERKLWAESMGYCMKTGCLINFLEKDVAEKSHISAVSDGGEDSFENLILLCANCHTEFDKYPSEIKRNMMLRFKESRQTFIKNNFESRYDSFEELKVAVIPFLEENKKIFEEYGPHTNEIEIQHLWKKSESKIIVNNAKIKSILSNNLKRLHSDNQKIIQDFFIHLDEFINTRDDAPQIRKKIFPTKLLSIFGLEQVLDTKPYYNLSALQNFILLLQKENRFLELKLTPELALIYQENSREIKLNLKDTNNIKQILFSNKSYQNTTDIPSTKLRTESLIFILEWLKKNQIQYKFCDFPDLTRLNVKDKYEVLFLYEYCVSLACLQEVILKDGLIVVNLHNWNGAPSSDEARIYAMENNIKLFSQNEFLTFAPKNLK